jgi:hypothetical protein
MANRRQAPGISTRELAAEHARLCRGEAPATHERYDEDGNEA